MVKREFSSLACWRRRRSSPIASRYIRYSSCTIRSRVVPLVQVILFPSTLLLKCVLCVEREPVYRSTLSFLFLFFLSLFLSVFDASFCVLPGNFCLVSTTSSSAQLIRFGCVQRCFSQPQHILNFVLERREIAYTRKPLLTGS